MALPFTGVPVILNPAVSTQTISGSGDQLARWTDGNLYAFGMKDINFPTTPFFALVNKSTDNGASWTTIGGTGPTGPNFVGGQTLWDTTHGFLHLVYGDNVAPHHTLYARFNLNTATWDLAGAAASQLGGLSLALRSDGTVVVFSVLVGVVSYTVITAGAFGATTAMGITNQTGGRAAVTIPGDTIRLCYGLTDFSTHSVTLTTGGAISSPDTLPALGATLAFGIRPEYWPEKDALIFPFVIESGFTRKATFFYGTPSASPVWTTFDLHDGLPSPGAPFTWFDESAWVARASATSYYFFWITDYTTATDNTCVVSIYCSTFDGTTVAAPQLFWDLLTNPAGTGAGVPLVDFIFHNISAIVESNTILLIAEATPVNNPDEESALTFASTTAGCVDTTVTLTGPLPIQNSSGANPHSIVLPPGIGGQSYPAVGTLSGSGTGGTGGPTQTPTPVTLTSTHGGPGPDSYTFQLISGSIPDGILLTVPDGSGVISATVHDLLASGIGVLQVTGNPAAPSGVTTYRFTIRHTYTLP